MKVKKKPVNSTVMLVHTIMLSRFLLVAHKNNSQFSFAINYFMFFFYFPFYKQTRESQVYCCYANALYANITKLASKAIKS